MDATIKIRGAEEYGALMKAFPEKAEKAALAAMRKAAQTTARSAKAAVPQNRRSIVKGVAKRSREGGSDVYAVVGLVAHHRGDGKKKSSVDRYWQWIRAYWLNYGTLSTRKRGHAFTAPRKRGTRDWKGGIEPRLFWDNQETRLVSTFQENLQREYVREIEKAYGEQK